jgi:hypothetical protein
LSFIRKVFGPAAIALGFLVFLGAVGTGVQTVSAAAGDFCEITGPEVIQEGRTYVYAARLEDNTGRVDEVDVDLDDASGDSDITSIVELDSPYQYDEISGVDQVDGLAVLELTNANFDDIQLGEDFGWAKDDSENTLNEDIEDILNDLEDVNHDDEIVDGGFEDLIGALADCGDTVKQIIAECIDNSIDHEDLGFDDSGPFCDENAWEDLFQDSDITLNEIAAEIELLLADGEIECDDIAEHVDDFIIGLSNDDEDAIVDDIFDICAGEALDDNSLFDPDTGCDPIDGVLDLASAPGDLDDRLIFDRDCDILDSFLDDLAIVDVTCYEAGEFDLTFTEDGDSDNAIAIDVVCLGDPSDESTITARPNKVEIVPAVGSVSHSLITVELLDEDGEPAGVGFEVDFTTNRCTIETSGVDTWEEFDAADTIFRAYNVNVPATAAAVEASAAANAAVDSTRDADTVVAFDADGDAIAAAILGCSPSDTGGTVATPGVATITAVIEVLDGQDVIESTTVTVVGPPADLKVTAAPSTLKCGEKATITATVKDSIGQNVSEHTRIEAVTNLGGVLGGTGAVAGAAGPVVPVSSTVAETYNGVATFYLLTSESHVGPYEVVVTTGGGGAVAGQSLGGVFSTAPQVAQQTVTCTGPAPAPSAPAPTITGPRTGTGSITPPSTGDAGLAADTTSSSWSLFAVIGAAAFAVAGLAGLKVSRR